MGIMSTIRDALALPALAARGAGYEVVPYESPWASPNHLVHIDYPDIHPHHLTRRMALSVSAVARARRLIVGSIARCPLEARTNGARAENQPIWMTRTDGAQSPTFRMTWTIDDLLFYGWSLWGLERDVDHRVIRADRVPFELWDIDAEGRVIIGDQPANPEEVCLIPSTDEGLLTLAADDIRHSLDLRRLAQRAADTPAAQIDLHQKEGAPLAQADIERLTADWIRARRSPNGGVAYSSPNIDVRELGKADTNLLIEGRNAAAVDLSRALGVPATMLDAAPAGTGSVTYENAQARNAELVDYCLAPYMAAVAARLGQDDIVPRGWAVAFDLSDLTSLKIGDLSVPDDDKQNYTDDPDTDDPDTTTRQVRR